MTKLILIVRDIQQKLHIIYFSWIYENALKTSSPFLFQSVSFNGHITVNKHTSFSSLPVTATVDYLNPINHIQSAPFPHTVIDDM